MQATAEPKENKINGIPEWEAENLAETLTRSFEIKRDPRKLKAAMTVLRRKQQAAKKALGWAGGLT